MVRESRSSSFVFVAVFLATLFIVIASVDRIVIATIPQFAAELKDKNRLDGSGIARWLGHGSIVSRATARQAKADQLFWLGNVEGAGAAIDLLRNANLFNQLFPGYGRALFQDNALWRDYFQLEFGPDSFLGDETDLSQQGFRVAYSWTGCFEIYQKYGADVLVLGSSETYKALVPSQIADDLVPVFSEKPKVLFCVTHGMPVSVAKTTVDELLRLSAARPRLIIWGYSFWMAYRHSQTLAGYENELAAEYTRYHKFENVGGSSRILQSIREILHYRLADFFPVASWDRVMSFSLAKARAALSRSAQRNREGIEVPRVVAGADKSTLDSYLTGHLKPYYDLVNGISESDCSVGAAQAEVASTMDGLRKLSQNVFIYMPPTTHHHRATVPGCFIPAVTDMLKRVSENKGASFLEASPEDYGLDNRDFLYSTLDADVFYFDVNHANFDGGRKITSKLTGWIRAHMSTTAAAN
jgi:hypothetical protein